MPFKIPQTNEFLPDSPEALFRDLRTRKIQGLLAHQADILRDYSQNAERSPDVAFELPTGSGKTLVGLLLAEWRRRRFEERCVYLCPTNQLVNQVANQAIEQYGIAATAFTGKKATYSPEATSQYIKCETVAITSYGALFNTNPFFKEPHLIILDDVHSAENYIASHWSLRVERHKDEHLALFGALLSVLKNVLDPTNYQALIDDDPRTLATRWVDKIATPKLVPLVPELVATVDAHVAGTELRHSWSVLREHVEACHLYVGVREILLRPLIPPTNTHSPFASARQRIYMSATLGEGGELERLTGRKPITRLKVPAGWDRQGIGRRLFFFPGQSLDSESALNVTLKMIETAGRALILVPDSNSADTMSETIQSQIGFDVFRAQDIERSKKRFVVSEQAVAVIANRYDGIDFIGDECRLLVISGLPKATNLQEQFIISKMRAGALLYDRINTRTVQAFGRCTRSATDYAAVVVLGEELHRHLLLPEQRRFLHPELQAELEFGIEQAGAKPEEFVSNLELFLDQAAEWQVADNHIVTRRGKMNRERLPGTENLKESVSHELEYQYAMWEGDYVRALDECRAVLAQLTDESLRGYRALWNYLAGSVAWLCTQRGMIKAKTAYQEYYKEALNASGGAIRWLAPLARLIDAPSRSEPIKMHSRALSLVERLEDVLTELGTQHDHKYAQKERTIRQYLLSGDSRQFEEAHKQLGYLLGFQAGNQETQGAPDPWWIVDSSLCFIFEDHSNAKPESKLSIEKARQVALHPDWVHQHLSLDKTAEIIPILVTPVQLAEPEALTYLGSVYVWNLNAFRSWSEQALSMVRELRRTFTSSDDLGWRESAIEYYRKYRVEPEMLIDTLPKAETALKSR